MIMIMIMIMFSRESPEAEQIEQINKQNGANNSTPEHNFTSSKHWSECTTITS